VIPPRQMGSSVQQHVEQVDVAAKGNGNGENLVEVSGQGGIEWAWLFWLNRRMLCRCLVCGLVAGTIVAYVIPKEYQSTTRLMPPSQHSSGGSGFALMEAMSGGSGERGAGLGGSALGSLASDLLGLHNASAVFADMLKSRTVQDRMIERFDLRRVYWTRYWESARKKLTSRTAVSIDRKSDIMTITVTDTDPNRAAAMASAYVEELDRISAQLNTGAAHRERVFIEQRLVAVKHDLDEASRQFSEYSSNNATLDLKQQGIATVEAAAVLQGQLIAAESELEGLEQIYTDSNVRIRTVRARVDELQRQLKKVSGSDSGSASNSGGAFPSIRQLPLLGVRWADLYRQTKIEETVYELLTSEYEMAKIEEAKETPSIKVLDVAVAPERKSFPPRALIIFLCASFALVGGMMWIMATTNWHRMDSGDPKKQLAEEIARKCFQVWHRYVDRWKPSSNGNDSNHDLNQP
jgi:capsule polysaccharide export protein KpsE/RkpR